LPCRLLWFRVLVVVLVVVVLQLLVVLLLLVVLMGSVGLGYAHRTLSNRHSHTHSLTEVALGVV